MKLQKVPKMHYATINNEFRLLYSYILVTKDDIVATDGHMLVVHKTKKVFPDYFVEQLPDRFLVKNENWKILCKGFFEIEFSKEQNCIKILSRNNATYLINIEFEDNLDIKYVEYNGLFDAHRDGNIDSIGISPRLLYNLSMAMDSQDIIELNFESKEKAILVKSEFSKGIIMPILITW